MDPNEPTYCTCNRVSFGDMVACENDACPIEWFHYECVGALLLLAPLFFVAKHDKADFVVCRL